MRKPNRVIYLVIIAIVAVLAAKQFVSQRQAEEMSAPPQKMPVKKMAKYGEGLLPGSRLNECLKSNLPTLAEFGLGTCKVCVKMQPILQQMAKTYAGKANIVSVDLDEYADLAKVYRISAMPTQIFFDAKGKIANKHVGYLSGEDIEIELADAGAKK
jgi:thioredoxin 1